MRQADTGRSEAQRDPSNGGDDSKGVVGVDVSKGSHWEIVLDTEGEILLSAASNEEGFSPSYLNVAGKASILMSRLQRVLYRLRVTVHPTVALVGAPIQFHRRLPGLRQGLRAEVLQLH